jgi:hypothetical protein
MRRRRNRTAPSAEFMTVYPPQTPFSRLDSATSSNWNSNLNSPSMRSAYDSRRPPTMNYP